MLLLWSAGATKMAQPIERVGINHPDCCQANNAHGQCEYRAAPGSKNCPVHAGGTAEKAKAKRELLNLRLNTAFGKRVGEIRNSGNVKNLTDEIAMLRTALEAIGNMIESQNDVLVYVDRIDKLAASISKLVDTWQKIQEKNKELMGRETVLALFDQLMDCIVQRVTDPDALRALADDAHGIVMKGIGGNE